MDDTDDSLFEGMVLFDPASSPQLPVGDHVNGSEVQSHREISQQRPQSPSPATTTATGASSEPLDENLFSDLTLIQPQSQYEDASSASSSFDPSPPPSLSSFIPTDVVTTTSASASASHASVTSISDGGVVPETRSTSRQTSGTRKKKRAGLRIGYGRAAQSDVEDTQTPQPFPSNSTSPSPSPSAPVEAKVDHQTLPDSAIKQDSTVAAATVMPMEEQVKVSEATPSTEPAANSTLTNVVHEEEVKPVHSREISMELRYDQIKTQIADKLNCARQAVASLSARRKDVIRKRRKAAEELELASAKHKEMEKELEQAVESEDFETAERVSDSLASAEKNKELLSDALREAEAGCDAIDSKMQEVLELQIVAEEECAALLESFAKDADDNADYVISNAKTTTSEEMEKWLSLSEALEVKKMEAGIESYVLCEAREVLDDSIEHTVKDDREESEVLHKRKETLTEELERLLALVKQKEAEIAENDLKIELVEKRIADVVSNFQEAQSNIHAKIDNLQSGLSRLELDNEALSRRKKEIDDFLCQEEARGSKIKELGRISADEAGMYQEVTNLRKSLVQFISKTRHDKERLSMTEKKLSDDVQILKQDISALRASLQDLSSTKSRIHQSVESSKQRLLFIEKRVPELESEKRVAATARNFKEAARIANETKTLYAEKQSLQTKTEEAMTELKKTDEDIDRNVSRLKEKEEEISRMEEELATVRHQRLLIVAGAANAERSAAMELGDVEEADILLKEAQAADSEAKKLRPTFVEEEISSVPKQFVSMEVVSTLDKRQLAALAAATAAPHLRHDT